MTNADHVSENILRHKLDDVEETFNQGLRLYRFELVIGSTAIGVTTLVIFAVIVWITSTGASREAGIAAIAVMGALGLLAMIWLRNRVRRWTRELVIQTNNDRAAAYQLYFSEQK